MSRRQHGLGLITRINEFGQLFQPRDSDDSLQLDSREFCRPFFIFDFLSLFVTTFFLCHPSDNVERGLSLTEASVSL